MIVTALFPKFNFDRSKLTTIHCVLWERNGATAVFTRHETLTATRVNPATF